MAVGFELAVVLRAKGGVNFLMHTYASLRGELNVYRQDRLIAVVVCVIAAVLHCIGKVLGRRMSTKPPRKRWTHSLISLRRGGEDTLPSKPATETRMRSNSVTYGLSCSTLKCEVHSLLQFWGLLSWLRSRPSESPKRPVSPCERSSAHGCPAFE